MVDECAYANPLGLSYSHRLLGLSSYTRAGPQYFGRIYGQPNPK